MMRSVLAVLAGLVVAGAVITLLEAAGHFVFPPPAGMDPANPESLKSAMRDMPAGALWTVLIAWALGSLAGGWVAARIATRSYLLHALIVGGIMLIGGIVNMAMIPHPLWFWVAGVIIFLPSAYAGARRAGR